MPIPRVPFYTNEQYASADLNTLQRVVETALEDLAGFSLRAPGVGAVGAAPGADTQPAAAVLGGLNATATGASLIVAPGLLCTSSYAAADNPSDSGAYLAVNPDPQTIAIPSPVSDTWYIVSGSPAFVDAAAVPVTTFDPPNMKPISPTPSKVKRRDVSLTITVTQCTTANIAASLPTDAVPLWAVFRPAGGGSIDPTVHLVDLRPSAPRKRGMGGANILRNQWRYTAALKLIAVQLELDEVDLYASGTGLLDPMAFVNPSDAATSANEWWYLYLARFRPLGAQVVPRHAQLAFTGLTQQGILVFSKIAPNGPDSPASRRNSAALHAAIPFNAAAIAAGDAMCFGALRRNSTNNGWLLAQAEGDYISCPNAASSTGQAVTHSAAATLTTAPPIARTVDLQVSCTATASSNRAPIFIEGTTALGTTILYGSLGNVVDGTDTVGLDLDDIPVSETGLTLTITNSEGAAGPFNVRARGYRF